MKKLVVVLLVLVALLGGVVGVAVGARQDSGPGTSTTDTSTTDTTSTDTTTTDTTSTDTTTTATTTTAATTTTTTTIPGVPAINYGVADDTGKYADDGGAWFDKMLAGANLTEERWTLAFDPKNPTQINELPFLLRAAPQAQKDGIHVVLALYARPARSHNAKYFCGWAAMVAASVQQWGINDFIVWNEPNTALYGSPQKLQRPRRVRGASRSLLRLDPSRRSRGARRRLRTVPAVERPVADDPHPVYRGGGRRLSRVRADEADHGPDVIHPYPNPSRPTDGPGVGYANKDDYGIPNLARVKQAIYVAFHGTAQPTTLNGLTFRIDELGWQTNTAAYPQYFHRENVAVVSEQTQAAYIQQTVNRYFACDPTVTDVEWFLLVDEPTRNGKNQLGLSVGGGWQSGLLTAGGDTVSTQKLAYTEVAPLFAEGRSACSGGLVRWSAQTTSAAAAPSVGSTQKGAGQDNGNHRGQRQTTPAGQSKPKP